MCAMLVPLLLLHAYKSPPWSSRPVITQYCRPKGIFVIISMKIFSVIICMSLDSHIAVASKYFRLPLCLNIAPKKEHNEIHHFCWKTVWLTWINIARFALLTLFPTFIFSSFSIFACSNRKLLSTSTWLIALAPFAPSGPGR